MSKVERSIKRSNIKLNPFLHVICLCLFFVFLVTAKFSYLAMDFAAKTCTFLEH